MSKKKTHSREAKNSRSSRNSRSSKPQRSKSAASSASEPANGGSLLIRGGRVIDPAQKLDAQYDLLLRDGKVAEIAPAGKIRGGAQKSFDERGLIVAPGFIDLHVHLREPGQSHKETIATGTAAAAVGGFTTVCPMPNTTPVNDSPEITRWMQQPQRRAAAKVHPIAAATIGSNGERLTDFKALVEAGAVAVTDDGRPILGDSIMREALQAARELGIPVIQHAEDTRMSQGCTMHEGPTSFRLGLRGVKAEAEASIVARDIELAAETKARLHVAHLSTDAALKQVRQAREQGVQVTCEVTPHHLLLTDEEVGDYDTNCKMNPPLRAESDRQAMLDGLRDGSIDCIGTDHAPHADRANGCSGRSATRGTLALLQSCQRDGLERCRSASRRRFRRHNHIRSRRRMDIHRERVQIKIEELPIHRQTFAGTCAIHDCGWMRYVVVVSVLLVRRNRDWIALMTSSRFNAEKVNTIVHNIVA